MNTNPLQKGFSPLTSKQHNERMITELERRIAHYKQSRSKLVEEALQTSSSNPRKEWLLERAKEFAKNI